MLIKVALINQLRLNTDERAKISLTDFLLIKKRAPLTIDRRINRKAQLFRWRLIR